MGMIDVADMISEGRGQITSDTPLPPLAHVYRYGCTDIESKPGVLLRVEGG